MREKSGLNSLGLVPFKPFWVREYLSYSLLPQSQATSSESFWNRKSLAWIQAQCSGWKAFCCLLGGEGGERTRISRLSALWNLGFGLFHIIYKVFFFFFLNSWLNCPGVLMTSKNYCFFKMVTLHVEVRNAFCRRRFAGESIPTENELNKPNRS